MKEQSFSLTVEKEFNATPEMIFDAWLDQENIGHWLTPGDGITIPNPKIDPVVGGKFDVAMKMGDNILPHFGEYKKINRASELQFTWNSPHGTNGIDTLVTLSFESISEGKTKLTLVHNLLPTEEQKNNHQGGWGHILDCLYKFSAK